MNQRVVGLLAGLGLLWGTASGALALTPHEMEHHSPTGQFEQVEQPLGVKIGVTVGGLALIGLELWWFLLSKPKAQQSRLEAGRQTLTIEVDGGYSPSQVVVKAGRPVRLRFHRKDPNSCLEQVLLPDFHIAADLPMNQTRTIDFIPEQPGEYFFTCGMNMFRGVIKVEASNDNVV
ncbi:cupredoxin domain-containing protein [Egbenema bharatensis]|uniref:cupredoxin domain-containing protein n=1 Tax=Egbenema bharatensis TaxID=3463334 RepID=UPI003A83EE66